MYEIEQYCSFPNDLSIIFPFLRHTDFQREIFFDTHQEICEKLFCNSVTFDLELVLFTTAVMIKLQLTMHLNCSSTNNNRMNNPTFDAIQVI